MSHNLQEMQRSLTSIEQAVTVLPAIAGYSSQIPLYHQSSFGKPFSLRLSDHHLGEKQ